MYYNQTHNKFLLIYIKKQALVNGLETTQGDNTQGDTIEWGKTVSNEKTKKKTNLKKIISTLRNMCESR